MKVAQELDFVLYGSLLTTASQHQAAGALKERVNQAKIIRKFLFCSYFFIIQCITKNVPAFLALSLHP